MSKWADAFAIDSEGGRLGKKEVRGQIGFVKFEIRHSHSGVKYAVGNMTLTSEERSKLKINM